MKFSTKKQKPAHDRRRPDQSSRAVFSYYARGASPSEQNTGRNQNKAGGFKSYRMRLGHVPSYIALVAIVFALGKVSLLDPKPKIVLAQVPGTVQRDAKAYQDGVQAIWEKSVFNRTKLTVSTDKLEEEIRNQFAELENIEIELPLVGSRPTIRITPTKPALELVSGNGAFFVSRSGEALARTADLSKNQVDSLAVIQDDSGVPAEVGKTIIPAAQVEFLRKLAAQLRSENIAITSITLPRTAANQVDLRVEGQAYYVKFSMDTDPRQVVGTYLAAKTKLEADGIKPAEYIDVRVAEKVFYK